MPADLQTSRRDEVPGELLRNALKSQYNAALAMLREAVERCPDALWVSGDPPFWQIAYHTVFFAHFYMGQDEAAFRPWEHHRPNVLSLDAPPGKPPPGEPYTRAQMLDYLSKCAAMIGPAVDALDLRSRDSGFPWYQVSKFEHQIINIRHIQHHAIYLSAALRSAGQKPVTWISPAKNQFDRS